MWGVRLSLFLFNSAFCPGTSSQEGIHPRWICGTTQPGETRLKICFIDLLGSSALQGSTALRWQQITSISPSNPSGFKKGTGILALPNFYGFYFIFPLDKTTCVEKLKQHWTNHPPDKSSTGQIVHPSGLELPCPFWDSGIPFWPSLPVFPTPPGHRTPSCWEDPFIPKEFFCRVVSTAVG